jgi:UDPglucose 6-dehydrogenase
MNLNSIAVIGQGFVGGSLTTVFTERGFNVYAYDKSGKYASGALPSHGDPAAGYPNSIAELIGDNEGGATPNFSGVYFVCVPTPMYEDGSADLSIVESVLDELSIQAGERIAVVKSTVPPGSNERWNRRYEATGLRVVFNPEFLTEANALEDMRNQTRIVLGGPLTSINTVEHVFQQAFPDVPIIKTSSTTAEMVKYLTNNFLTVKVAFANEITQVCEALDNLGLNVDYDKVVEYSKYDRRLGDSHWAVPGPDGYRGFGGHCIVRGTVVSKPEGSILVQEIEPGHRVTSASHLLNDLDVKIVNETHARLYDGEVITFVVNVDGFERKVTCTPCHILPVRRDGQTVLLQAKDILASDELFVE